MGRLVQAGGYTGLGHGFCPNDSGGVGLAVQFFASSVVPVTGNLPLETEEPSPDATIGVTPSHWGRDRLRGRVSHVSSATYPILTNVRR